MASRLGSRTRQDDVRQLICESTTCNPDLPDYEASVRRFVAEDRNRYTEIWKHIVKISRRLIHTPHVPVPSSYDPLTQTYIYRYKCQICGYSRKY